MAAICGTVTISRWEVFRTIYGSCRVIKMGRVRSVFESVLRARSCSIEVCVKPHVTGHRD